MSTTDTVRAAIDAALDEALAELRERLSNANRECAYLANQGRTSPDEAARLRGKAEGVQLAISYLDEAVRARSSESPLARGPVGAPGRDPAHHRGDDVSDLADLLAQAQEIRRKIETETLGIFGERVKRARAVKGWTQDELATLIGLTRSSVANIESGRQDTPLSQAAIIANALDTTLGDLLNPSPPETPR